MLRVTTSSDEELAEELNTELVELGLTGETTVLLLVPIMEEDAMPVLEEKLLVPLGTGVVTELAAVPVLELSVG